MVDDFRGGRSVFEFNIDLDQMLDVFELFYWLVEE